MIGSVRTSVAQLLQIEKQQREVKLADAHGHPQQSKIHFLELQLRQQYTFLDYISSGYAYQHKIFLNNCQKNIKIQYFIKIGKN
jgi:hypothetical protein